MARQTGTAVRRMALLLVTLGVGSGSMATEVRSSCDASSTGIDPSARILDSAATGLEYGPHGGVAGLVSGAYVCVAFDAGTGECLVRAIREEEIATASADGNAGAEPGWMRASLDGAGAAAVPGEPPNVYGLPGLLTVHLDPQQTALVRCLAGTRLGRPLAEWDDPWVYQRGIVEQCEEEARRASHTSDLPLAARHLQEAALILNGSQRVADANQLYSSHAGIYAGSVTELVSATTLRAPPSRTPAMTAAGYTLHRANRITVELQPGADDVCRALNLLQGRAWQTLPAALPDGSRSGCYLTPRGFRFEFGG
jgi:hypothetical protein